MTRLLANRGTQPFRRGHTLLSVGLTAILGACRVGDTTGVCETFAAAGVVVYVKDSTTGSWAGSGSTMIISTTTATVDSVAYAANRPDLDSLPFAGAWEQPGVFDVTIRKSGFRDWRSSNVVVVEDGCHVRPVLLTALLQPD